MSPPPPAAFTVTTKDWLAVNPPASCTVRVMVEEPVWPVAGVTVTVRFAPLPPKTTLATGMTEGLEEAALNVRLPAAVSPSPTVNGIAALLLPVVIDWLATAVRLGAVFAPGAGFNAL